MIESLFTEYDDFAAKGAMESALALHPAAPGLIPGGTEFFSNKFFLENKLSMLPRLIKSAAAESSGQHKHRLNYIT